MPVDLLDKCSIESMILLKTTLKEITKYEEGVVEYVLIKFV